MARVIPFAFWVCLLLLLGSISGCTGYSYTKVDVEETKAIDSLCFIPLKSDADVTRMRITIHPRGEYRQAFYLTPGNYDFGGTQALVKSVVKATTTDEGKAKALWKFVKENTSHSLPLSSGHLPHYPLHLINSFGSGLCDDRNTALTILFKQAGFNARVVELGGHMVAEVSYDHEWHMYDADLGVYYLNDKGKVASVDYISGHPEIVTTDFGKGFLKTMLGKFTTPYVCSVYASNSNNRINNWQEDFETDYNSSIEMVTGNRLVFDIQRLNNTEKFMKAAFLHSLPDVTCKGVLTRNWPVPSKIGQVWHESLPYAATEITISQPFPEDHKTILVYYSPDSVRWFYRGTLQGNSRVTFVPFSKEGEACAFSYFLKFMDTETNELAPWGSVNMETHFLFSPLLFTNPEKTFKIVHTDSSVDRYLWVKTEYTK